MLVGVEVLLEKSDLAHQVFVGLVLMNHTELVSQNLSFFFDQLENQNLFIFVQLAIATLVKDLEELSGCLDFKHVKNDLFATLEH